ncbi:MAG: ACP S-malonyltransferase [Planctomycetota bacterium]
MTTKRAFLFPGQGAQYATMGKDLCSTWPAANEVFSKVSERLGFDLAKICFEGSDDDLVRTDIQQPAILTHSIAAMEALRAERGNDAVRADAACGLSLGEYSALVFAGVLSVEDGAYLVRKRGEYMQEASEAYPSTLAAVMKKTRDDLAPIVAKAAEETGEHCVLGNLIGETNITISGGKKAIDRAVELIKEIKGRAMVLAVAGAFHSPYMKMAEEKLAAEIERTTFNAPRIPVVCNVDATPTTDVATIRANLLKQLTSPVLWHDSMQRLVADGFAEFVETGPGKVLTGTIGRVASEAVVVNVDRARDLRPE